VACSSNNLLPASFYLVCAFGPPRVYPARSLLVAPPRAGLDIKQLSGLNEYWDEARNMYSPFESGQLTGESQRLCVVAPTPCFTEQLMCMCAEWVLAMWEGQKWPPIAPSVAYPP
jgi:hypothetical protein